MLERADEMDDRAYWRGVAMTWSDSEGTRLPKREWRALLGAARPGREHLMNEAERAELAALPDRVPVYRGWNACNEASGLSWLLDRERAAWSPAGGSPSRRSGRPSWWRDGCCAVA